MVAIEDNFTYLYIYIYYANKKNKTKHQIFLTIPKDNRRTCKSNDRGFVTSHKFYSVFNIFLWVILFYGVKMIVQTREDWVVNSHRSRKDINGAQSY